LYTKRSVGEPADGSLTLIKKKRLVKSMSGLGHSSLGTTFFLNHTF
jgi:hypothetical protein